MHVTLNKYVFVGATGFALLIVSCTPKSIREERAAVIGGSSVTVAKGGYLTEADSPEEMKAFFKNYRRLIKGVPYRKPGYSPYEGLDCSTSIIYALKKTGFALSFPITSSSEMDMKKGFMPCSGGIKPGDFFLLGSPGCTASFGGVHWVTVLSVAKNTSFGKSSDPNFTPISRSNWNGRVNGIFHQTGHSFDEHHGRFPSWVGSFHLCNCTRLEEFNKLWKKQNVVLGIPESAPDDVDSEVPPVAVQPRELIKVDYPEERPN